MNISYEFQNKVILAAAFFGFTAVLLGAFGAHGLKKSVSAEMLAIFETGVRYQLVHALALLALASLSQVLPSKTMTLASLFWGMGILIFSGSLYILVLSGVRKWGMVTPIGGLSFLTGWVILFAGALKR